MESQSTDEPKTLTTKQQRFVEEYCVDFNATQAAIRAGYSERTASASASRMLRNVKDFGHVQAAIQERLDEMSMSADEALKRLTDMGRGSLVPFVRAYPREEGEDGGIVVDLSTEEAQEHFYLLKKIKQTRTTTRGKDDYERVEVKTEIEIHDPKDAVKEIAKVRGLHGPKGTADDPKQIKITLERVTRTLDEVTDEAESFDG